MVERDEAVVSASADRGVSGVPAELAQARVTIDNIDAALVHILAERFRCTQRVGHIKARLDLPPADPEREARQVERLRALAASSGLDPDFAEKFLGFMVREVIRHHEDIKAEYDEVSRAWAGPTPPRPRPSHGRRAGALVALGTQPVGYTVSRRTSGVENRESWLI